MPQSVYLSYIVGSVTSVLLIMLPLQPFIPVELSLLETIAVVTYAWSVWLLAKNHPVGWWIGLVGTALYSIVFYQARLYAEVGLQVFYCVTSLQAIHIWLRGGPYQTEKPVEHVSRNWLIITAVLAITSVLAHRLAAGRDWLTNPSRSTAHSRYCWIGEDAAAVPESGPDAFAASRVGDCYCLFHS